MSHADTDSRGYARCKKALALVALASLPLMLNLSAVTAVQAQQNGSTAQSNPDGTFTLNLKNADIHSLISTVSKQSGRNFVVDPRVKAKITVISAKPLDGNELYETFLSVLQVHGYSAVPSGDLIKIVPDVNAKQGPVPTYDPNTPESDQLVTQVIKIVNVPAAQLVPILRPLVPQQGHLAAYAATNALIVTDRANNINRLIEIIQDVDRPDNEEVEIVRVEHASAAEIIRILSSLQTRAGQPGQSPGAIRFAADERTNSILLSGDSAARIRMRGLISNLDTPVATSSGNTRVVYLRYASAADLVQILTGVSQGQSRIGASTDDASPGGVQQNAGVQQQGTNGAVPQATPTASIIRRATQQQDDGPNIDIQADEDTNALIITAPPDEMRNILAVIEQLDIRRAQVLVEAIIAELSENNSQSLGVNFAVDGSDSNRPVGLTNLGGQTQQFATQVASEGQSGLAAGLQLAVGRFGEGGIDFGFLLSAIASDSDNNILSTPTLVTMDNQEAEIIVGQNVPFVTGTQLSASNDNPFQTIERQDIGISLRVRPQINEGDNIRMDIEQEVSDVSTTSVTGASDITTNRRAIRTTVLVEDGQTLVLGGLLDDQNSFSREKVPVLGDLPLLGNLFRFRTSTREKTNLMVFLHPTILRDVASADYYSRNKYDDIRLEQVRRKGFYGYGDQDPVPLLPELRLYYQGQPVTNPQSLNTIVPASSNLAPQQPAAAQPATQDSLAEGNLSIERADVANQTRLIGPFDQNKQ